MLNCRSLVVVAQRLLEHRLAMDVSGDSAHTFFTSGIALLSHVYSTMHIHEAATWRHWLINAWVESPDASIIASDGTMQRHGSKIIAK